MYTMSNDIEVSIRNRGDVAIIDIKGDVTGFTGEPIEDAYQQVTTDGSQKILFGFDNKCYINSGGIAILISIVGESQEHEQTMRITGLSDHFHKIFDMVGITRYFKIFS